MNTNNSDQKKNTLDVRQRTFAVTTAGDTKNVLRTGYIGPCVAFYGRHKDKKVVFMSHVDGNIFGYKNLEAKLKALTNEDLEGFSLYATTNYTISLRVIAIAAIIALALLFPTVRLGLLILFLSVLYLCFGSLIQIYLFSILRFKKPQFKLQRRCQLCGRVTVSIDAASEETPSPSKESMESESKKLYGTKSGHCWLLGQKEITSNEPE